MTSALLLTHARLAPSIADARPLSSALASPNRCPITVPPLSAAASASRLNLNPHFDRLLPAGSDSEHAVFKPRRHH